MASISTHLYAGSCSLNISENRQSLTNSISSDKNRLLRGMHCVIHHDYCIFQQVVLWRYLKDVINLDLEKLKHPFLRIGKI
jgi:hypothetical protein